MTQNSAPAPGEVEVTQLEAWRQREVQMLGAALSKRNWHDMETAYNQLRDKMDRELIAARHRLAAEPSRKPCEDGERIREALAARDRKAGECPDTKLDPDKDCPRCGASRSEGCRVTALADVAFVRAVRQLVEQAHV